MVEKPAIRDENQLTYYTRHSEVTDPGRWGTLLGELPPRVDELVAVIQTMMVHVFWAERYGLALSDERRREVELRTVSRMLDRALELDDQPLTSARPLERRLVGNCRDHSVLLTSALRQRGVPARARCGFATYFLPDHFEDHWVCEYWDNSRSRWVRVDPQLDTFQREALGIGFDPLDVPRDQFVVAGSAWSMCRSKAADPNRFGIFDLRGLSFVLGDLIRDFLSLNRIELLPWDPWGLMTGLDKEIPEADLPLLDRIARLSEAAGSRFPEEDSTWSDLRALYRGEPRLRQPPVTVITCLRG